MSGKEPAVDEPVAAPKQTTSDSDASSEPPGSVFDFPKENGRTYHGYRAGTYVFPNDTPEIERLDLQHELFKLLFNNNLHLAPLATDKPLRVIDIGTGTGQWAIDLGDQYPLFQIQGTDLSPIQPSSVPPNVEFFVDDATEHDWGVDAAHFDYVHMRAMCGSFESYKSIIERSFHYLKPGAWMEIQEFMCTPFCDDDSLPPNWPFYEWSKLLSRAGARVGRSLDDADQLKKWCEEVGFVDVHEQVFHLPVNAWARDARLKEVGRMHEENILEGLGGFSMAHFTRTLGWSKDEIEVYLVNVRKSISDRKVHLYHKVYVVWGRKPL